jgi:hypothetical protein
MRTGAILFILVTLYVSGVIARHRFGIAVVVRNQSQSVMRSPSVKVNPRGLRYPLPDLSPGQSSRVYVQAVGESSIDLEFIAARNLMTSEMLAAYVEPGYCGSAKVRLLPGGYLSVQDDTFRLVYWKSWLEFLM